MKKNLLCILTDEKEYLKVKKNFLIIDKNILDILEARNFFTKNNQYRYVNNSNNQINNKKYYHRNTFFIQKKFLIYKRQLIQKLNTYHKVNENQFYWGQIVDMWLINLITVAKFRMNDLFFLKKNYKNISIVNESRKKTYNDSAEFNYDSAYSGRANQYIYSRIANILKIKLINHNKKKKFIYVNNLICFRKFLLGKFFILYIKLFKPFVFFGSSFSTLDKIKLFFFSKGKVFFGDIFFLKKKNQFSNILDNSFRGKLKFEENDIFDKCINSLIGDLIPKNFVENFSLIVKNLKNYSRYISGISTSYYFYYEDIYKILSAEIKKNKGKLYVFEHGHYHIFYKQDLRRDAEKKYLDFDFRWDTKDGIGTAHFSRLKYLKEYKNNNSLITLFLEPRYKYNFKLINSMSKDLKEKSLNSLLFYRTLSDTLKSKFLLRPFGINFYDSLQWKNTFDKNPKAKGVIDLSKDSKVILGKTKIFVANYFSNSFFEALYLNIPIIIFFNLESYNFDKETNSFFNKFEELNIFHRSSKSAAEFLNLNYYHIELYWNSKIVQDALDNFRKKCFGTNTDYIKNILKQISS